MTYRFCDFLGDISGWRPRCLEALAQLSTVTAQRDQYKDITAQLAIELSDAKAKIRQLELLVPRPPPPKIDYIVERDSLWIQGCLDSMGLGIVRFPLDAKYRLTNQRNALEIILWDWVDTIEWRKDVFDCENHAITLKAHVDLYFDINAVGIVLDYVSSHAYNLWTFADGHNMLLEPQQDQLFCWTQRATKFYALKGAALLQ